MAMGGDIAQEPRVIGGSPTDRLLGMLIERTEALRDETKELRAATNDLRDINSDMRTAVQSLTDRLANLERSPVTKSIESRLEKLDATGDVLERRIDALDRVVADNAKGVADWRATKGRALAYLALLGVGSLFGGSVVGSILSKVLGVN